MTSTVESGPGTIPTIKGVPLGTQSHSSKEADRDRLVKKLSTCCDVFDEQRGRVEEPHVYKDKVESLTHWFWYVSGNACSLQKLRKNHLCNDAKRLQDEEGKGPPYGSGSADRGMASVCV